MTAQSKINVFFVELVEVVIDLSKVVCMFKVASFE